jgi:hypothetical protein
MLLELKIDQFLYSDIEFCNFMFKELFHSCVRLLPNIIYDVLALNWKHRLGYEPSVESTDVRIGHT